MSTFFLYFEEDGMYVGEENKADPITEFRAIFRLADVTPLYSICFNMDGHEIFAHSTDNVSADILTGEDWQKICSDAKKIDPKMKPIYDSFDLNFVLLHDLHTSPPANLPIRAGSIIRYITSKDNYRSILPLIQRLMALGVSIDYYSKVIVRHEKYFPDRWIRVKRRRPSKLGKHWKAVKGKGRKQLARLSIEFPPNQRRK